MFNQIKDALHAALVKSKVPPDDYYRFNWKFYQDGSGGVNFYRFGNDTRNVVLFKGKRRFEAVLENLKNGKYTKRINQLWLED